MKWETLAMLFVLLGPSVASANPSQVRLDLSAEVGLDAEGSPTKISGAAKFSHVSEGPVCFQLPYLNESYGNNRGNQQRMDRLTGRKNAVIFTGGSTELTLESPGTLTPISDTIVQYFVPPNLSHFTIKFSSTVPLPPNHSADDWFYDGFYPQLLHACPTEATRSDSFQLPAIVDMIFDVTYPSAYRYAGLGEVNPLYSRSNGQVLSQSYVFALSSGMKSTRINLNDFPIEIHYREEWFLELIPSLERLIPTYIELFGKPAVEKFVFMESSELQRNNLPGLIAINRPRQSAVNSMLKNWLNWHHWLLARAIANQWIGTEVTVASPDDLWLLDGLNEYAALEALRRIPKRYNLFQPNRSGRYFMSFDFLQIMEISAASLRRSAPFTKLTDKSLNSIQSRESQHPLAYIRHAIALNQIAGQIGHKAQFGILRNLIRDFQTKHLTPKAFAEQYQKLPSPLSPRQREETTAHLEAWWTSEGWPDFELEAFDKKRDSNGRWITDVKVAQIGEVDFPPIAQITDFAGSTTRTRMQKVDGYWRAQFASANEPQHVDIDPDHESFDSDRFNNTDRWPSFKFFPGSANTLADDGYTVIWVPYAFRNPGEPVSIAFQSALFRYINGGLFGGGAIAPSEKLGQYQLRHRYQYPGSAIHGDLSIAQTYESDRVAELSIIRSPVFDIDPIISLSGRLRHKQRMGQPDTAHETIVAGFGLKPVGDPGICGYNFGSEYESSPPDWHPEFSYERRWVSGLVSCNGLAYGYSLRVFGARVTTDGTVPEAALFKPNDLNESRLRLDTGDLSRVAEIGVVNNDFQFPLVLPLPSNSLVLSRRIKGRVFYDLGKSFEPLREYRSSGLGFSLPFGGDLSGAGSLSITRLTVLGILYSHVGGETSKKPSIVFDFSGQL